MKTFSVSSQKQVEMIEITTLVRRFISEQAPTDGLVVVYTPHTTAAITINENADPDVCKDITMGVNKIVPMQDGYLHLEGNSAAHVKATLVGSSVLIPLSRRRLALGRWQGVFLCDFDGPRTRRVQVTYLAGSTA